MTQEAKTFSRADMDEAFRQGVADAKRACQNILVLEDHAAASQGLRCVEEVYAALRRANLRIEREVGLDG